MAFIGPALSLSERFSLIQNEKSKSFTSVKLEKRPQGSIVKKNTQQKKNKKCTSIQDRLGPKSAAERLGPPVSTKSEPLKGIQTRGGKSSGRISKK